LDVTHQLMVCADNVNMLGEKKNSIRRETEALLEASREVCLEVDTEETKCVAMAPHRSAE